MWWNKLLVLTALALCAPVLVAENWAYVYLEEAYELDPAGKDYRGQLSGGKRRGLGTLRLKDGGIYAGGFEEGKMTGRGIILMPDDGKWIANCDSCAFYVGAVQDGKKSGRGRCYNPQGQLIYSGEFVKDKPVGAYPSTAIDDAHEFVYTEMDSDVPMYFFGEILNGTPDGMACIYSPAVDVDGMITLQAALWLGRYKAGTQSGTSLYLYQNGAWETYYFNKEGEKLAVSSSREYDQMEAAYQRNKDIIYQRQAQRQSTRQLSGFLQALQDVGNVLIQLGENIQTFQDIQQSGGMGAGGVGSGGSYQSRYNQWAQRAEANYNSLTNLGVRAKKDGKDVGGTAGQGMSSSNYTSMKKSLREAQREMKSIRQKARRAGITIPKSQYEDITVKY
ncbi:MAG: hypothetical protein LIP02_07110 [Bacteroidales bacterium]|nr:hypothetical protein [Bacteroidales bacterium]